MQISSVILYKSKYNMHLTIQKSIRWFKTNKMLLGEEDVITHRGIYVSSIRKAK